jgi:iron complex transport system substrate-binding protein
VLVAVLSGCDEPAANPPARGGEPRLVSLSPAITDILFDVGLGDRIVGVSRYCLLPPGQDRKVVGDMMTAETETLLSVEPTHLLFQGPANRFRALKRLDPGIELISIRLETLDDVAKVVKRVGKLVGRTELADQAIKSFREKIERARRRVSGREPRRVVFIIDSRHAGIMAAAAGTFVDELIVAAGGINAGRELPGKPVWRKTDPESVLAVRPEVLICQVDPSEREGAARARQQWSRYLGQPGIDLKRVEVVDDPRWTFPSTRVADLSLPMARLIHPEMK